MKRMLVFGYGAVAYLTFFVAILYAIGFVGNFVVPKAIDSGVAGSELAAMAVNASLLGIFAIQHTIMARKPFKQWLTQFIPAAAERSTFVLVASVLLLVMFYVWIPMPAVVWQVDNAVGAAVLTAMYFLGWFLVFFASFLINHFDLFGLRQVYLELKNEPYRPVVFRTASLYKFIRHPLLLGFLVAFWSAPVMTQGRLLFAVLTTAYIFVGIQFEERDLRKEHGDEYRRYQQDVPMIVPYRVAGGGTGSVEPARRTEAAR